MAAFLQGLASTNLSGCFITPGPTAANFGVWQPGLDSVVGRGTVVGRLGTFRWLRLGKLSGALQAWKNERYSGDEENLFWFALWINWFQDLKHPEISLGGCEFRPWQKEFALNVFWWFVKTAVFSGLFVNCKVFSQQDHIRSSHHTCKPQKDDDETGAVSLFKHVVLVNQCNYTIHSLAPNLVLVPSLSGRWPWSAIVH